MDSFDMMVDYLEKRYMWVFDNINFSDEQIENSSLALVESVLLNGYTITDRAQYKPMNKLVRIN
jgi:hypothetical protein